MNYNFQTGQLLIAVEPAQLEQYTQGLINVMQDATQSQFTNGDALHATLELLRSFIPDEKQYKALLELRNPNASGQSVPR